MAAQARELFLTFDQQEIIRKWDLTVEGESLCLGFAHEKIKVSQKDGTISFVDNPGEDGKILAEARNQTDLHHMAMVVYDYLCYAKERPHLAGRWESISSLGGIIGAGHDRTLSDDLIAAKFAGKAEKLERACQILGGRKGPKGDVGYILPVIGELEVYFQFYDEDDEFPASMKYFWDANVLAYMHYETLWYAMGAISERLIAIISLL